MPVGPTPWGPRRSVRTDLDRPSLSVPSSTEVMNTSLTSAKNATDDYADSGYRSSRESTGLPADAEDMQTPNASWDFLSVTYEPSTEKAASVLMSKVSGETTGRTWLGKTVTVCGDF